VANLLDQIRGALARDLEPLRRRVIDMIARAVVERVDDSKRWQEVSIQVRADEVRGPFERVQGYGFSSVPHEGAEAIVARVGGSPDHSVVIAVEDRRYRVKNRAAGEVTIYDDQGQAITLYRDRVEVEAPKVVVNSPDVEIHNAGGLAEAARKGDATLVDSSTDAAAVNFLAAVEALVVAMNVVGGQPPSTPVTAANIAAFVAAYRVLSPSPVTTITGKINAGSSKVKIGT